MALAFLAVTSCSEHYKHPEKTESKLGKYVYIDYNRTLHVDRKCISNLSQNSKTVGERMQYMEGGIRFIDTMYLTTSNYYNFCPICVDDKSYERIMNIVNRN